MYARHTRHISGASDVGARETRFQARYAHVQDRSAPCGLHVGAAGHHDVVKGIFRDISPPRAGTHTHTPPNNRLSRKHAHTQKHTHTQIQRYFDSLPEDKVPKIGSTGERHRDKQLAFQLPKQDLSLAYCKHVEPNNQSSYEDFVAARNEIALDIGM